MSSKTNKSSLKMRDRKSSQVTEGARDILQYFRCSFLIFLDRVFFNRKWQFLIFLDRMSLLPKNAVPSVKNEGLCHQKLWIFFDRLIVAVPRFRLSVSVVENCSSLLS